MSLPPSPGEVSDQQFLDLLEQARGEGAYNSTAELLVSWRNKALIGGNVTIDGGEGGTGAAPLEFSNHVASQDPNLMAGLVPSDKKVRVYQYHRETLKSVSKILGAAGIAHPSDLRPWHILRRTSPTEIHHYGEIYDFLEPGDLLADTLPQSYARTVNAASPHSFAHAANA